MQHQDSFLVAWRIADTFAAECGVARGSQETRDHMIKQLKWAIPVDGIDNNMLQFTKRSPAFIESMKLEFQVCVDTCCDPAQSF